MSTEGDDLGDEMNVSTQKSGGLSKTQVPLKVPIVQRLQCRDMILLYLVTIQW